MSERDKYLTEQMGDCWHEWDGVTTKPYHDGAKRYFCKCGIDVIYNDFNSFTKDVNKHFNQKYNFSIWAGFGKLWEWAEKQDWWYDFHKRGTGIAIVMPDLINPGRFADAIYQYLKRV